MNNPAEIVEKFLQQHPEFCKVMLVFKKDGSNSVAVDSKDVQSYRPGFIDIDFYFTDNPTEACEISEFIVDTPTWNMMVDLENELGEILDNND